jgi:flagellar assembly factor FliW
MNVEVVTSRFGKIEVPPERIFFFPRGLIGFEHLKKYALLDSAKGPSIQWLQALDDPETAFLVSKPSTYIPTFELKIWESDASQTLSEGVDLDELETLAILHVDRAKNLLHIHVQAPLLLEPVSRKGVQVITDAEQSTVTIPLKSP